jgi:hypothetical protein
LSGTVLYFSDSVVGLYTNSVLTHHISFYFSVLVTSPSSGYTGQDIDSSRKLNALESGGKFELDDMSNSQASKEFQRAREQERERLERQRERRERRERKARDNADEEGDSEGVKTMQQHSIPV